MKQVTNLLTNLLTNLIRLCTSQWGVQNLAADDDYLQQHLTSR